MLDFLKTCEMEGDAVVKMHTLLETFYEQIGEAYLVNRPEFFADLLHAGGCTHSVSVKQKTYKSDDYRYKLFKGSKPISKTIKRAFPNGVVNVEEVAALLEGHINRDADRHCPALMTSLGINQELGQNASCLAMALALQFKAFIDDKENEEVADIIATEYERLILEESQVVLDCEPPYEQDEQYTDEKTSEPSKQTLNQINITQNIDTIQSGGLNIGFVGQIVESKNGDSL